MSASNVPFADQISLAVDLLLNLAPALADKAKHNETVLYVLDQFGLKPDLAPPDFEGCYIFALVEFNQYGSKPRPVLEFFRHYEVRRAFQDAYPRGETLSLIDILDWHRIGDELRGQIIDIKAEIDEFTSLFDRQARRSRPAGDLVLERVFREEFKQLRQVVAPSKEPPVNANLPIEEIPESASAEEKVYLLQIGQARELLLNGKPNAGKNILDSLTKAIGQTKVSDSIRFKLETNLGACELDLGNDKTAAELFERALQFAPENPKAIANAALAELIKGNYQSALELAKQALEKSESTEQTSAPAIYIHAFAELHGYEQAETLLEESHLGNADYLRAMGKVLLRTRNYLKAEEMFRRAIAIHENDDYSLMLLAETLFLAAKQPVEKQVFISKFESIRFAAELAEAEELADRTIEWLQKGDNRQRLNDAIAARAGLRAARGRTQLAIADCDGVLAEDSTHRSALQNRGLLAYEQGNLQLAIDTFSKIPEMEWEKTNVILPLADAHAKAGNADKALEILGKISVEYAQRYYVEVFMVKVQVYLHKKDNQNVSEEINRVLAEHPNEPVLLEAVAYSEFLQGHHDKAVDFLLEAYSHATGYHKQQVALRIAIHYYHQHQFEAALPYFNEAESMLIADSPFAVPRLITLYNLRRYADAYQVAQQLRSQGSNHATVIEILAWISEQTGDLKSASDYYAQLAQLQSDKPKYLISQARAEFRQGNKQAALAILKPLQNTVIEDAFALMEMAEMLSFLGEPEGVEQLAYRARQIGFDEPTIHLAYIQVFHNCSLSNPQKFEVDKVDDNTSIFARDSHGSTRWLTILKGFPASRARDEFSAEDPLAQSLLGHRKGDVVQIKKESLEELNYAIEDIQSIYVRAYQETFDNFGTWFPNDPRIAKIHFDSNNPTKLLTIVAGRSTQLEQIYSSYDRQYITFSQFAALTGKSEVELWGSLVGQRGRRLIASFGMAEEQERHHRRVRESDRITIDVTALLTSAYLGILTHLPKRFTELCLPQTILDALNTHILRLQTFEGVGFKSISFEDGRFIWQEIPRESIQRNIENTSQTIEFIRSHCVVVPLSPGTIPFLQDKDGSYLTDQNSIATMLVARQTNSMLYSDDLRLRVVSERLLGVPGFWTQPMIANLMEMGQITEEDYFGYSVQLIRAHYYFVAINPKLLIYVFKKNALHVNADVEEVLNTLRGPSSNENDAVRIIAEGLRELWLSTLLLEQKLFVLDHCLRVLVANRVAPIVLQKLYHYLDRRLLLAPLHHDEMLAHITMWRQRNGY